MATPLYLWINLKKYSGRPGNRTLYIFLCDGFQDHLSPLTYLPVLNGCRWTRTTVSRRKLVYSQPQLPLCNTPLLLAEGIGFEPIYLTVPQFSKLACYQIPATLLFRVIYRHTMAYMQICRALCTISLYHHNA